MPAPESEQVLEIAREWFEAARGGQIASGPFSQFIAIWIAFNALYTLKFGNVGGDRKQVVAFSSWAPAAELHQRLLELPDYRRSVAAIADRGVYNAWNDRNETISDASDLTQVVQCAYLVRCNLFHGRKTSADVRDRQLTEAARLIVHRLVQGLLSSTSIWDEGA